MEEAHPNPAHILHDHLRAASVLGSARSNQTIQKVWSDRFAIGSPAQLVISVTGLVNLSLEVVQRVREVNPDRLPSVQSEMEQLQAGFMLDLAKPWQSFWNAVAGDRVLPFLDITSGLLDTFDRIQLRITDTSTLLSHVHDLLLEVESSDLDDKSKEFVRRNLARIYEYLAQSAFRSTTSLADLVDSQARGLLADKHLIELFKRTNLGKAFLALLVGLSVYTGYPIQEELGANTPGPAEVVLVSVQSKCYSPKELESGTSPLALEAPSSGNSSGAP